MLQHPHPAVADALSIHRRELRGALPPAHGRFPRSARPRALRARQTDDSLDVARLNDAFDRWSAIWTDLAVRRPQTFRWHPRRLGPGPWNPFSLAFLYARAHSPKALRSLELTAFEDMQLRRARPLLRSLTGLPCLGRRSQHWQFDGRCLALRSVPLLGPGGGYGAWSYAEEWRLRHQAVFSLNDIKARRQWGGRLEVCTVVLHEELHAAFASEVAPGSMLNSCDLAICAEEAITSVFELAAGDYLLRGTLPTVGRIRALARGHGYGHAVRSLLAFAQEHAGAPELLGQLTTVNLDVLTSGGCRQSTAAVLSAYTGQARSATQWEALLTLQAA